MAQTIHMIGPNGQSYDMPEDVARQAARQGFRFATQSNDPLTNQATGTVTMRSPQGSVADVPVNKARGAQRAGFMFPGVPKPLMEDTDPRAAFGMGVAKEASRLAYGVGQAVTNQPDADDPRLQQLHNRISTAVAEDAQDFLAPTSTGEKAGEMATDFGVYSGIGEMMPFAGSTGLGGRMIHGALTGGAGAGVISGGDPHEMKTGAAIGGIAPAVMDLGFGGIKRASSWLLNNALEVPKSVYSRMNPGEYAIEHGSFDSDLFAGKEGMRESAAAQAKTAAQNIQSMAAAAPGRAPIAPIQQLASNRAAQWGAEGNQPFMDRANELYNLPANSSLDITGNRAMQTWFPDSQQSTAAGRNFLNVQRPPTVTASDLLDIRRGLSTQAGWNANPLYHPQTIDLARGMYGATNEQLHNLVPGIAAQDAAYSNLGAVGKLTDFKPSLWPWMMTAEMGNAAGGGGLGGALKNVAGYMAARTPGISYGLGRAAMGGEAMIDPLNNAFLAGHSAMPSASSLYNGAMDRVHSNSVGPANPFQHPSDNQGTNVNSF